MPLDPNCTCRLCAGLCYKENDNLFINKYENVIELIFKYLAIKINVNDFLPILVCESCRLKVMTFDDYALRCKTTQLTLSSLIREEVTLELSNELFPIKVECKEEIEYLIKVEDVGDQNIKSEDDFCNEDILPLSQSITKKIKKHEHKSSTKKKKQIQKKSISSIDKYEIKQESINKSSKIAEKKPYESIIHKSFFNFSCHICKEVFQSWHTLKSHVSVIHSSKSRVLCLCDKYLTNRKSLYCHMMKHDKSIGIECEKCDKKFIYKNKYYYKHLETHTANEGAEFKCSQCPKTFANRYVVQIHEKTHIPLELRAIYSCEICEAKFATKRGAMQHKRVIHDKLKPFICDECGKNFGDKGHLKAHQVLHSDEKNFSCTFCSKTFKNKRNLKRHMDYHNGVTFKCTDCSSVFNHKKTLDDHMFIHRDVYRYICGYCNKGFKWKPSFKTHINNHTGATPYECPWCPKKFPDGPNCRIHKRRKHPVELAELEARQALMITHAPTKRSKNMSPVEVPFRDLSKFKPLVFPKLSSAPPKSLSEEDNEEG